MRQALHRRSFAMAAPARLQNRLPEALWPNGHQVRKKDDFRKYAHIMHNNKSWDELFKPWRYFLNNVVGVLAFSLGMASLGTDSPSTNATISMLFLFILIFNKRRLFPPQLIMLRTKDNRTQTEEDCRRSIEKKQIGLSSLFKLYTVYASGWAFLIFVAASKQAAKWSPLIDRFLNGQ